MTTTTSEKMVEPQVKMSEETEATNETSKPKVKVIFKEFAEQTTAHGFSRLVGKEGVIVRVIWLLLILACGVMLANQILPLVKLYGQRPKSTRIQIVSEKNPVFPSIVICNENMFKKSLKEGMLEEHNIVMHEPVDYEDDYYGYEDDYYDYEYEDERGYLEVAVKLPLQDLQRYGHTFNETILKCTWKNLEKCRDEDYWQSIWHYKLGQCFVFNSGFDDQSNSLKLRRVSRTGQYSALELLLSINLIEYENTTKTAGMRVYIGDQGALYSPVSKSLSVAPGFSYSIGIEKEVIKRVDPFKNETCMKHKVNRYSSDTMGQTILTKYTKEHCYQDCLSRAMLGRCDCLEYWLPTNIKENNESDDVRRCARNGEDKLCVKEVMNLWDSGDMKCLRKCNAPCDQINYRPTITMQRFPVFNSDTDKANFTYQRENLVKVSIFFTDLEHRLVEDYIYYQMENLLSDIGGQLGLFSGYSALTVFEIVLFLVQLIAFCLFGCCLRKQKKNRVEGE